MLRQKHKDKDNQDKYKDIKHFLSLLPRLQTTLSLYKEKDKNTKTNTIRTNTKTPLPRLQTTPALAAYMKMTVVVITMIYF